MRSVVFTDGDVPLAGHLHEPEGGGGQAAVVTGSWLTVKEQMPDRYAAELATRGWTALSFDFAGFGASGGSLRQVELPNRKMANVAAAVRFLSTQSGIRRPPVVLGVCATAQYVMAAIADGLGSAGSPVWPAGSTTPTRCPRSTAGPTVCDGG
jgi:dienelactone hydrolase